MANRLQVETDTASVAADKIEVASKVEAVDAQATAVETDAA